MGVSVQGKSGLCGAKGKKGTCVRKEGKVVGRPENGEGTVAVDAAEARGQDREKP